MRPDTDAYANPRPFLSQQNRTEQNSPPKQHRTTQHRTPEGARSFTYVWVKPFLSHRAGDQAGLSKRRGLRLAIQMPRRSGCVLFVRVDSSPTHRLATTAVAAVAPPTNATTARYLFSSKWWALPASQASTRSQTRRWRRLLACTTSSWPPGHCFRPVCFNNIRNASPQRKGF